MSIATQIFEIYIRRREPKDIDYDEPAALLLVFVTIAISTLLFTSLDVFKSPVVAATGAILLELAVSYGILYMHEKTSRFIQMASAGMGVTIISYCLILLLESVPDTGIMVQAVHIWGTFLSIIILRDALECSFIKAMTITFIVVILSTFMIIQLFGDAELIRQQHLQTLQEKSRQAEVPAQ
jgi:hypothetical protein